MSQSFKNKVCIWIWISLKAPVSLELHKPKIYIDLKLRLLSYSRSLKRGESASGVHAKTNQKKTQHTSDLHDPTLPKKQPS